MSPEKIGNIIKKIRKDNGLTQEKFADKFGVTYQAVSKWENGKNIPDISVLMEICSEYKIDFNDLLSVETKVKKKNIFQFIGIIIILISICALMLYEYYKNNNNFELKALASSSDNFSLFGTIAYNNNKTSIYISNITYEGEYDSNLYKEINCTLYEIDENTKTIISSYDYNEKEILLEDFLKQVNFSVNHYSDTCKMYQDNHLRLEIEATDTNNHIVYYKIPLILIDECD